MATVPSVQDPKIVRFALVGHAIAPRRDGALMNIVDAFFGAPFIATGNEAAAMSQDALAQYAASYAHLTANAKPSDDWYLLLAQYRPAVSVPQGFADWYAIGDEVH